MITHKDLDEAYDADNCFFFSLMFFLHNAMLIISVAIILKPQGCILHEVLITHGNTNWNMTIFSSFYPRHPNGSNG